MTLPCGCRSPSPPTHTLWAQEHGGREDMDPCPPRPRLPTWPAKEVSPDTQSSHTHITHTPYTITHPQHVTHHSHSPHYTHITAILASQPLHLRKPALESALLLPIYLAVSRE